MPSKYNLAQQDANIARAQEMMKVEFPSVNKEGKQLFITDKGGRTRPLPPFKYDPAYIKKSCGLNMTQARIIGLYPTVDVGDTLKQLIADSMRNGFRRVKNSKIGKKAAQIAAPAIQKSAQRGA